MRLWRRGLGIDILVLVDEEVDAFELGLSRGSNDAYYGAHPSNPMADPNDVMAELDPTMIGTTVRSTTPTGPAMDPPPIFKSASMPPTRSRKNVTTTKPSIIADNVLERPACWPTCCRRLSIES